MASTVIAPLPLSEILKGLRAHRQWTLVELARRTGISANWLSALEHGVQTETTTKLLRLLSAAYGMTPDKLLAWHPDPLDKPDPPCIRAARLRRDGMSMAEIGAEMGLSRQRVGQLLRQAERCGESEE